ncbi:MAG: ABC-2 transporter permease [Lachnospiraceae bacterium]|nr:ABC-2 transporter permease [Lachnospiraceae bacterium]
MRGLIEKDIRLMLQRKTFLLVFVAIAVILGIYMDGTFVVSYCCLAGLVFSISTLSYDEYDNGYPFLFSLPISRKGYAAEKLLFTFGCVLAGWIVGLILQIPISFFKGNLTDDITGFYTGALLFLALFLIVVAILVPVELHFGMEKSRIAMAGLFGGCFLIGLAGPKLIEFLNINTEELKATVLSLPVPALVGGVIGITLIIMGASYLITALVMEKKEF